MPELFLLAGFSLALSLVLIPVCRGLALHWNFVDRPDSARKFHRHPIPRIGGIPVMLAAIGSVLLVTTFARSLGIGGGVDFATIRSLAPAALLVFVFGLVDDIAGLRPWQKLAGEIVAGALIVSSGIEIHYVAGFHVHPWPGAVLTVVWLVGCANAVNLIDGLDGLAAGIALFGSMTALLGALLSGNFPLAAGVAPLAGALLGFLIFNFNPASIFLGDCGSLTLGFLLGCYGVLWSDKSPAIIGMTAPVIALAVPLLDTSIAIARRFLRKQPIFSPDRSHIHHRLLARGLSAPAAVLLLYLAAGIAGTLALFLSRARQPWDAVILVIFVCFAIFGVHQLGYAEFGALQRLLANDTIRRTLKGHIALAGLEQQLGAAATAQECWVAIEAAARELGFYRLKFQLGPHSFRGHGDAGPLRGSEVRIPISDRDWVELSHEGGAAGHATSVIAFAETIRKGVAASRMSRATEETMVNYTHTTRIEIKTPA